MANGYTVRRLEELQVMEGSGGATWHLARRGLGASALGVNLVEIEPGGQIPEHDEARSGQEEVYAVLEGEGTFVADGEEVPAPAVSLIRYAPATRRTIRNHSGARVRALLIGAPMHSGYEARDWL